MKILTTAPCFPDSWCWDICQ